MGELVVQEMFMGGLDVCVCVAWMECTIHYRCLR